MRKNVYLSTLLISSIIALSSMQGAFANGSSSASQTVVGTLGAVKQVVTNGGNIAATINETTGLLSAALTPGFTLTTNIGSLGTPVALSATANVSGGSTNALSGTGATGGTYIALTNNTVLPTLAAVGDAFSGAPTPAANANVIAYPVNKPDDIPGQLAYSWNAGLERWDGNLTHKGNTDTLLTIPSSTPKANTFSLADVDGSYQATITLSFVEG